MRPLVKVRQDHTITDPPSSSSLFLAVFFTLLFLPLALRASAQTVNNASAALTPYIVQVSATVSETPTPSIQLQWPADGKATNYAISRRRLNENFWHSAAQYGSATAASANGYQDYNVSLGNAYEYQVIKTSVVGGQTSYGYGYVYSGIRVPMTDKRGTIILVVDKTVVTPAASDPSVANGAYVNVADEKNAVATGIATLTNDLVQDGWRVVYAQVDRQSDTAAHGAELANDSTPPTAFPVNLNTTNAAARKVGVSQVRAAIQAAYNADPANVKARAFDRTRSRPLFRLCGLRWASRSCGRLARRRLLWKRHGLDGQPQPDASGRLRKRRPTRIRNYAGDGKFDQSSFPTPIQLQVGRIDFANMWSYNYPYQPDDKSLVTASYRDASGNTVYVPAQTIPGFQPKDEYALLARYLSKDHRFRTGDATMQPTNAAIVSDYFYGGQLGSLGSGWSNFASLFGSNAVAYDPTNFFFMSAYPAYPGQYAASGPVPSYLWGYGAGPGFSYTNIGGEGTLGLLGISQNGTFTSYYPDVLSPSAYPGDHNLYLDRTFPFSFFPRVDPKIVFNISLASFSGDYDNEYYWGGSFLRAKIATSFGLTNVWDNGFYHTMGLGQTIGEAELLTQNNGLAPVGVDANSASGAPIYQPDGAGGAIYKELMGDPTLRMFPVLPASGLTATRLTAQGKDSVALSWNSSADTAASQYALYRSVYGSGVFTRLYDAQGNSLFTATSFTDTPPAGTYQYMVRAVKLQMPTPTNEKFPASGSFYNPSEGVYSGSFTVNTSASTGIRALSVTADNVVYNNGSLSFNAEVTNASSLNASSIALTSAAFPVGSGYASVVTPLGTINGLASGATAPLPVAFTQVNVNAVWGPITLVFNVTDTSNITTTISATVTILKPLTLQATPTTLAGTPPVEAVHLNWTATSGSGVTYKLYRAATPGVVHNTPYATLTATAYDDSNFADGIPIHSYQVSAFDASNKEIARSNEVAAGRVDVPVVTARGGYSSVWVTWTSLYGVSFDLFRSTDPNFVPSPATRIATGLTVKAYSDQSPSLVISQTYYYRVTAYDAVGDARASAAASRNPCRIAPDRNDSTRRRSRYIGGASRRSRHRGVPLYQQTQEYAVRSHGRPDARERRDQYRNVRHRKPGHRGLCD